MSPTLGENICLLSWRSAPHCRFSTSRHPPLGRTLLGVSPDIPQEWLKSSLGLLSGLLFWPRVVRCFLEIPQGSLSAHVIFPKDTWLIASLSCVPLSFVCPYLCLFPLPKPPGVQNGAVNARGAVRLHIFVNHYVFEFTHFLEVVYEFDLIIFSHFQINRKNERNPYIQSGKYHLLKVGWIFVYGILKI